jgi:quinolinate synthase
MSLADTLEYTPAIARETADAYARVRHVIPEVEWPVHAPYVAAINRLKKEKNAVILAHNYMTPEIFHCVGDIVGDSLALAQMAEKTDADIIVLAGVHFMAETAKLMNPNKIVLVPDAGAGCTLDASITAEDVRELKRKYPGRPVVTYVNTSAAVKAESDICCTSSNAVKIVNSLGVPEVIMTPDEYLAGYVASQTNVKIIPWKGHCMVHEAFSAEEIREYRKAYSDIAVIAHPECAGDVLAEADFVGSTSAMINWVRTKKPKHVFMVTECSMSDNVAAEEPDVDFVRPCNLCPYMKMISLPKILRSLETLTPRVEIPADVAKRARLAVQRMLDAS